MGSQNNSKKKVSKNKSRKPTSFDPLSVTESLGYQTHRKNGRNVWSKEDDEKLISLVNASYKILGCPNGIEDVKTIQQSFELTKKIRWDQFVVYFQDRTRKAKDLKKRWSGSLDPNLKKGKWTSEEDSQLLKAYEKHGPHWLSISMDINGRTEDQCAKRYMEVLGPESKGRLRDWTVEEDLKLISQVKIHGTKWRQISTQMNCRPSLTCRNRWRKIITLVVRDQASPEITKAVKENKAINESLAGGHPSIQGLMTQKAQSSDAENDDPHNEISSSSIHIPINFSSKSKPTDDNILIKPDDSLILENPDSINDFRVVNKDENNKDSPHFFTSFDRLRSLSSIDKEGRILSPSPDHLHETLNNIDSATNSHKLVEKANCASDMNSPSMNPTHLEKSPMHNSLTKKHVTSTSEWTYNLNDSKDLPISNGVINTPDLVKELVKQAKLHNLNIIINQHVHNHYTNVTNNRSPSDNHSNTGGMNNSTRLSNSQTEKDLLNPPTSSTTTTDSILTFQAYMPSRTSSTTPTANSDYPLDTPLMKGETPNYYEKEWFSKSPFASGVNSLLSPLPQTDFLNYSNSQNSSTSNNNSNIRIKAEDIASYNKQLTLSKVSSPSSINNFDIENLNLVAHNNSLNMHSHNEHSKSTQLDVEPNRISHFNYLSPALRPQLGSSNLKSGRSANLGRILGPLSPSGNIKNNLLYIKKQDLSRLTKSMSNSPILPDPNLTIDMNMSNITTSVKQTSIPLKHSRSLSSMNSPLFTENEGFEFWESLKGLATVASSPALSGANSIIESTSREKMALPELNLHEKNTNTQTETTDNGLLNGIKSTDIEKGDDKDI